MCCSAAAFSVVIDLLSWYGRISWSGRETNATAMPVVVVVFFLWRCCWFVSFPPVGFWTIYISKRASFGETKRIPIRDDTLLIRKKKKEREQKQRRRRTNQQTRRRADPKQRLASRGDDRDGDGEHRDQETAVLQQNAFERKRCHFFLSFFLRQNVSRLFCALNLFYEDDDRYCIKVMVYPSTTICLFETTPSLCV